MSKNLKAHTRRLRDEHERARALLAMMATALQQAKQISGLSFSAMAEAIGVEKIALHRAVNGQGLLSSAALERVVAWLDQFDLVDLQPVSTVPTGWRTRSTPELENLLDRLDDSTQAWEDVQRELDLRHTARADSRYAQALGCA